MNKLSKSTQLAVSTITTLAILHIVMLSAFFSGVEPAPPAVFAPFIGATIAICIFALLLLLWQHPLQQIAVGLVVLMAIPGVGPQKIFSEPDIVVLSPIVILGCFCLVILVRHLFTTRADEGMFNKS